MGYIPPQEIDIGVEAKDRASGYGNNRTLINKGNPANASGKIDSIEIYAIQDLTNVEVATFFVVSGNYLSTRDTYDIGNVAGGSKQTISVDLDVQKNDYIGIFCSSAQNIECDETGGSGLWYKTGDQIPCENVSFSSYSAYVISLYGTGATGAGQLTIGEAFSMADSFTKNATKQLGETLSIVDSKFLTGTLNLTETLGIVDSATFQCIKTFYETLSIIDSKVTSGSLSFAETLSIVDSWTVLKNFYETLSITDTVAMGGSLNVSEIISIIDSFIRWIEHPIYTEPAKSNPIYTKPAKSNPIYTEPTKKIKLD